jgi:hypothetical protein
MDTSKHIERLINEIIPSDDYQHRNGLSNEHIIDKLSEEDKFQVEAKLIDILKKKPDMLIVETLGYMQSEKALFVLYELIEKLNDEIAKIITAVSIFEISKDRKMIKIAETSFKNIKDKYQLITAFHYLVRFQEVRILSLILEYTTNSDYLISYNAKQVLGM